MPKRKFQLKTFADLFCGIGGFHLGLAEHGLKCVWACEIHRPTAECYHQNFGIMPEGDITQIDAASIPDHDVLCAGFPCQPFSIAGRKAGTSDSRGLLFYEIVRIAERCRPKVLLLENVMQILSIEGGGVLSEIYRCLERLGYRISHAVLNASHYGVPQQRKRVYFVAIRDDVPLEWHLPAPTHEEVCLHDIVDPEHHEPALEMPRDDITYNKLPAKHVTLGLHQLGYSGKVKRRQGNRIYDPMGHAATICAKGNPDFYLIGGKVRRLSQAEDKRAMGFPANHILSTRRSQLGNAVVPPVISRIWSGLCLTTPQALKIAYRGLQAVLWPSRCMAVLRDMPMTTLT